MVKATLLALGWGILFYFVGLFACLWFLPLVSSNTHDVNVEAAMAGAFFTGPLFAIAAAIGAFLFHRPRKRN
jgi:hypothetical protein